MAAVEALFHKGYRTVSTEESKKSKKRKKKGKVKTSSQREDEMDDTSEAPKREDSQTHVSLSETGCVSTPILLI